MKQRSRLISRNINTGGGRSSMRLEREFWDALERIASQMGTSLKGIIRKIDLERGGSRTSAVRVFVLKYYMSRPGEQPDQLGAQESRGGVTRA